jgi:hypothetical protein
MLSERLKAARKVATESWEKMKAAYGSRDRAVRYLSRINEIHAPLGFRACTCRAVGGCQTREILDSAWVRDRIDDLELREWEERRREEGDEAAGPRPAPRQMSSTSAAPEGSRYLGRT